MPLITKRFILETLHGMMDHVRLPQIKLQCFDGNIDDWLSFRDLYTSLIHEKPDLPAVEKFHYLKGCLAGEAKALIDPLKITRDNYQVAWQTLLKRYNNNKLLKKKQVQAIIKLPSLIKESATDLHKLVDGFDRVIQTLDQIIQPADYKDLLLVQLLSSRLDPTTRRGWEEHSSTKQQDTVKDLLEFLQRRIQILEALPAKVETKIDHSLLPKRKPFSAKVSNNAVQSNNAKCPSCSEIHGLHICPAFLKMSLSSRESLLRAQSLCRNCLKRGHLARECASKFSCRYCKARHHSLLCFKAGDANGSQGLSGKSNLGDSAKQDGTGANSKAANASAVESTSSNAAQCVSSQVLLATAVVVIEDDQGSRYPARALLDSGSECNFITENLYQTMKVAVKTTDISIMGIGQSSTKASRKIKAVVKSRNSSYARSMEFLVLPKVTACLPTSTVQANGWDIPVDIELADPEFFRSRKVDLVLGIQAFFSFLPTGREIQLGKGLPVLTESVFGWIVTGEITTASQGTKYTCNMAVSDDLEELMARFWSCEEVGAVSKFSPEEAHCEENYERTVKRESDGRYTVTLPKNPEVLAEIGESKDIALRRLRAVERRLSKDERLRKQYSDFMTEYLELGHMRMVDDCEENIVKRCFLPHHPDQEIWRYVQARSCGGRIILWSDALRHSHRSVEDQSDDDDVSVQEEYEFDSSSNDSPCEDVLDDDEREGTETSSIDKEIKSLKMHGTCKLANLLADRKPVGSKWIFKRKVDDYGNKFETDFDELFGLTEAKSSKIPLDPGHLQQKEENEKLSNNHQYSSLIGGLVYVAVDTRPDSSSPRITSVY
ncbi:uncharacterized protein LOC134284160 [Aedes albopictus]|uniref:CCHC-type domain-containing protein n=1 Tax=Aedes albopictus TaxID=7160 RepID=A0ABM1ZCM0_AEDAL